VINAAFRDDYLVNDRQRLRSAAFLVELLNIDLFNYRTFHDHADNFHGTVYRGMCVSTEELSLFKRAATSPIAERYLSIPLAMMSASVDRKSALAFALAKARRDRNLHLVLWEIQVANLAPDLLSLYRTQFPDSVVTSLCAVPIDQLSDFSDEKEVLLRGPFFQILGVGVDEEDGYDRQLHKIEAVTLNTNRDHLTAIASNEGADRRMRDVFRTIILAHRSSVCAERAEQLGFAADAASYRRIAHESRASLEELLHG
jgi:hypothetical protein